MQPNQLAASRLSRVASGFRQSVFTAFGTAQPLTRLASARVSRQPTQLRHSASSGRVCLRGGEEWLGAIPLRCWLWLVYVGVFHASTHTSAELVCSLQSRPRRSPSCGCRSQSQCSLRDGPYGRYAILVSATGVMRSTRLGILINASAALHLASKAHCWIRRHASYRPFLGSGLPRSGHPCSGACSLGRRGSRRGLELLSVARQSMDQAALAFSLTLSSASRLVLVARQSAKEVVTLHILSLPRTATLRRRFLPIF